MPKPPRIMGTLADRNWWRRVGIYNLTHGWSCEIWRNNGGSKTKYGDEWKILVLRGELNCRDPLF